MTFHVRIFSYYFIMKRSFDYTSLECIKRTSTIIIRSTKYSNLISDGTENERRKINVLSFKRNI